MIPEAAGKVSSKFGCVSFDATLCQRGDHPSGARDRIQ
jgi:hypothetical protein